MRRRLIGALIAVGLGVHTSALAARGPSLQGLCDPAAPQPAFAQDDAFRVLLTRMAGPAESVRTAQDQWLPGEQGRVRQIGMAGSDALRGSADSLPGHQALQWQRTACFVQGPGAAGALGRAAGAHVVIWGQAACAPGDELELGCARSGRIGELRAGVTVLAELPQARPPEAGWRPVPLPHPVNWGVPVRDLDGGQALLNLVQGLERLQQGAPASAALLFERAGSQASGLQVEALLLAGDTQGAREVAELELARSERIGGPRHARALVSMAGVHWFRERQPMARQALDQAVQVAKAAGDRHVAAYATLQLGLLDEQVGDQAGAESAYASLVDHTFLSHDRELRAEVQAGLGRTRQAQGRFVAAHDAWLLALPAYQDAADPWALAVVFDGLASTGGRFEQARRAGWLTQSRDLWRDLGQDERALEANLGLVALAAQSERPVRESRADWEARLSDALAAGRGLSAVLVGTADPGRVDGLHRDLARIAMVLGHVDEARSWLQVAGASPGEQAVIERGLAEVLRGQDGAAALALYMDALAHAEQAGLLREQARIAARIADLQRKVLRDVAEAQRWSGRTLDLHDRALAADDLPHDAAEWARIGDVAMFIQRNEPALAAYEQAEAVDLEAGPPDDPQLPCKVGWALFELGRYDHAVLAYERGVRVAAARGAEGLARSCSVGAQRARDAARSVD